MARVLVHQLALAIIIATVPATHAFAHCFVGARFFPANLNVDDPCVADELSLPTVSVFKNGDDPSARETAVSVEFSKRITDTFGISVERTWTRLRVPGGPPMSGFQNLETTFKHQFFTDPARELVLSASLAVEWGGTGSVDIGAEKFSVLTPTLYLGKGFGDLPDTINWARPFAVTAQVGYSVPTRNTTAEIDADTGDVTVSNNPQLLVYGGSLQYSLPYLKSNVVDLGLPEFINRLIPIVEWQLQTQMSNFNGETRTTGTINPGLLWVGNYYQVGVEAIVPINRASGTGTGVIAQFHLFLDDIFPTTIGRPLLSASTETGRPTFGN